MGKKFIVPRRHQSYGKDYRFSGVLHPGLPIPACLDALLSDVQDLYETPFDQVLVNWYQDGTDYIGLHADNESQIQPGAPIVTVSLGETRTFRVREKCSNGKWQVARDFTLVHGTVLAMGGEFQRTHKHEVPRVNGLKGRGMGRRISVTFRLFRPCTPLCVQ